MDPETVTELKRSPSLSSSSSSSSSTSKSSSEDFFQVSTAKLSESALRTSPEVDREGQLVSEHGAEKKDLSISVSEREQHNDVLEQKSLPLPLPMPVNTSEQKFRNLDHVSSLQQSSVGGEFAKHGQCGEVLSPMPLPLPLPPPASASTLEPGLNQLSQLPQPPPDKDPRTSVPKQKQCDKLVGPPALPAPVLASTPELGLNHVSSPQQFPPGQDLGTSVPKTETCGKHIVSTSALPPTNPLPAPEPSRNNVTATESPPVQVMERRGSEPDPYRIPASIFATANPKASMEWSAQSNESLFSIHMASMSYTKEQISFFGNSGELGLLGDPPTMPGPLYNLSSIHHPTSKIEEVNPKMDDLREDLSVTEAAAETMKEVMMANASQQGKENDPPTLWAPNSCSISLRSEDSMGSHKSFAFPILTKGEGLPCGSVGKAPYPQTSLQPASPQPPRPQASTAATRPWFSCFSCCPYCS